LQQKLKEMAIQLAPAFAGITADAMEVKNEMVISKTDANTKIDISALLKLANQEKIDLTIASNGKTAAQFKIY